MSSSSFLLLRLWWFGVLSLGVLLTTTRPLHAGECAAPLQATPALGQKDDAQRLQFIRESLRDAARLERRFAVGWSLTYVGLAGASWALVPLSNDPRQPLDAAWNSAKALGASMLVLIEPLQVVRDQRRLEELIARDTTAEDRCAQLAQTERLLTHAARSEGRATHVLNHLGTLAVNVGLGLALGYGFNRPDSAAMGVALGTTIGEIMMATRPQLAVRRLASYRAGDLHRSEPPSPLSLGVFATQLGSSGYGVAVAGRY